MAHMYRLMIQVDFLAAGIEHARQLAAGYVENHVPEPKTVGLNGMLQWSVNLERPGTYEVWHKEEGKEKS